MRVPREIRSFDLFCGGGGSSIGAKQAGAYPVGGVDICPVAKRAFEHNLPGAVVYCCDARTLAPQRVAEELGSIDLLLASPECTAHSVARGNKSRSEESRQLAFEVIRFAKVLKPRWVVVENVVQMSHWTAFDQWCAQFRGLGYHLLVCTLNAWDFGVAQNRRRLFVIADRQREPAKPRQYRKKGATIAQLLGLPNQDRWSYTFSPLQSPGRSVKTIVRARHAIEILGPNQEFIMVYYGSDGAGGFQTIDRPLRTITTLDRFALVRPNCHGHEMRMLQPPELAAAMGFPSNYRWPDGISRRECIKLIGNAVCPPVIRAIVRALLKTSVAYC